MINFGLSLFAQTSSRLDITNMSSNLQSDAVNKLVQSITPFVIPTTVLSILILVVMLATLVRKWMVQTAILKMRKDVAMIKEKLVKDEDSPSKSDNITPL